MKIRHLHDWEVTAAQAQEIQRSLAAQVSKRNELDSPRLIAGVDISGLNSQGIATGAVVVLSYPELNVVETEVVEQRVSFPYVPGLLSLREAPVILSACERLSNIPDLVLVDGQGIAHPRRLGLASHLGLFLDTPTIGCAKSRLCGNHEPVAEQIGCYEQLKDGDEVIGAALHTKNGSKLLYVSIGHKVDLEAAIQWVLACCRGYRLPEPTRLAHLAAGGHLTEDKMRPRQEYQQKLLI